MGETINCCPSRGFASARKNFSDSRENPDLVSWSRGKKSAGMSEWIRERIRTNTSERAADCRFERASERASFIGSVWMQFGRPWLRVSEGPRNIDHSALLKDSTSQGHLLRLSVYASVSRLRFSSRSHPRVWIPLKTRANEMPCRKFYKALIRT